MRNVAVRLEEASGWSKGSEERGASDGRAGSEGRAPLVWRESSEWMERSDGRDDSEEEAETDAVGRGFCSARSTADNKCFAACKTAW